MSRIGILDLPRDVWLDILSYFSLNGVFNGGEIDWKYAFNPGSQDLSTLQAVRLVCRRLQQTVNPLLCPVVRVGVDTPSIERIMHLSQNPRIAPNVRAVQVNLTFRSAAIASDFGRYISMVQGMIGVAGQCCRERTAYHSYSDTDQSSDAIAHRAWLAADATYARLEQSWRRCKEHCAIDYPECTSDNTDVRNSLCPSDETLLHECFQSYRKKSDDQNTIVKDGSYLSSLVLAISRFTRPMSVNFCDRNSGPSAWSEALEMADNPNKLAHHMTAARTWEDVEKMDREVELLPAKILVDLPLTCDRVGAPLKGLYLASFPFQRALQLLGTTPTISEPDIWARLAAACRELETFHFGSSLSPSSRSLIDSETQHVIDNYLGAACSGPQMRSLSLNLHAFGVFDHRLGAKGPCNYRVEPIINRVQGSRLQRIRVTSVITTSEDLERLIGKLHSSVRCVNLHDIQLESGGYASTIETLRDRLSTVRHGTYCHLELSSLQDGEFGFPGDYHGPDFGEERFVEYWEEFRRPSLLRQALAYVFSVHDGPNPLRAQGRNDGVISGA